MFFFFKYINYTSQNLLKLYFERSDLSAAGTRSLMTKNVVQLVVWGAWLLISLRILHVSNTWLMVISGGLSTGVGFAMKDILENIYYGISLMAGRIKLGDWIEIDGTVGKVTNISYTSTMVESLYGEVIAYQNSQLFTKNYKNLTKNHGYVLAVVPFGVAYGSNIAEVTTMIEKAVNDLHSPWIDRTKQAKIVVGELGDNSVNFKLFIWADAVKKVYVVSEVVKTIYDTLNAHGVGIPFPQRDVHIIQS